MLAITVQTESGPALARPSADELAALLRRIGGDDDHFAVVERIPGADQVFLQTWREGDGPFAVEHRDGGPERHFEAEGADAGAVAGVFLAWARGTESWRTALDWRPADLYSTPGPDPQTRAAAEARARTDIRTGCWTAEEVAQGVCDAFGPDGSPVTVEQARRIVARRWQERLAEQAHWPAETDPDRVARAFGALASQGLTALMNFACCSGCALSELAGERAEGDRGFVFFPYQDTAAAADGHGLSIRYGAYPDSGADSAAIGRAVTAALTDAGLPVVWNGDPTKVVEVTPLRWHKRLPSGR
ncbi:DUF6891 domain-containing protein [Streptomyces lunalinharesii]|uniref:DUF6891 domain-containing protein n=1 Tax=Streptomyces lunalinharesii TaxID=333384 RepID=A0ABP6DTA0_9ACTN